MLVWKHWLVERQGPFFIRDNRYVWYEAQFEGLFLFGFIPLWICQREPWKVR